MRNPEVSEAADYSLWDDGDLPAGESETGVAQSLPLDLTVGDQGARRLDKWLAEQLPEFSRVRLKSWIEAGAVQVDGKVATVRTALWGDQIVRVTPMATKEEAAYSAEPIDLAVVFEDDTILVVNKPAGLVVHPGAGNWSGTLLNGLLWHLPELASVARAGIVHRLDKDTTGLMVVAKTQAAQTDLVRQLQARTVSREYLALVAGTPESSGTIDVAIGRDPRDRLKMTVLHDVAVGAKPAITHFRTLGRSLIGKIPVALLGLRLQTGRTHQIRVHLAHRGWPIVGDQVYAPSHLRALFARQALHAGKLGLVHPQMGTAIAWQAPIPSDFAVLLQRCQLSGAVDAF
jgi:23S rRNA pseudouridine1911/1915/1917 synthase